MAKALCKTHGDFWSLLYVEQEGVGWGDRQRGGRERGGGGDVKRGWELSWLYSQGTQ